jgi:hypothetical protein
MEALLDDRQLTLSRHSLAAALAAARSEAEAAGRVVVEVSVDGLIVPEAALASPSDADLGPRVVRFTTADPRQLVAGTLRELPALLDEAREQQAEAAKCLNTSDTAGGMKAMQTALTNWETVRSVVANGLALLGIEPKDIQLNVANREGERRSIDVEQRISALADKLTKLREAMRSQDWVGVSDVLGYDLGDEADEWSLMLRALAAGLDQR